MDRKKDFGKKLVVQAWGPLGKSWERSLRLRMPVKLHRISGPHVQVRSHKPEGRQFKSDRRNKRSCICGPFQEICKEGRAGASQQTVRVTSVENLEVEEAAANHRDHRRVVMEVVETS
jgi:hypothetical protein